MMDNSACHLSGGEYQSGSYIEIFEYSSEAELSITDTSPDLVQSLEFFMSRLKSGFCLDQIKTRFESGLGLDNIQISVLK